MVHENALKKIRDDIARYKTAEKATIVAASKTVPPDVIAEAYELGITDFGENRADELKNKYDKVPVGVKWHFIGRLQTNKVKHIIDKVVLIHSLDSERLLVEINRRAKQHSLVMPVLVEVNMGREEEKGGVFPEGTEALCQLCFQYPNVALKGVMCVFPVNADTALYDEAEQLFYSLKARFSLSVLSMGMSADYVTALQHGATMIRPGRAIFGERK